MGHYKRAQRAIVRLHMLLLVQGLGLRKVRLIKLIFNFGVLGGGGHTKHSGIDDGRGKSWAILAN